VTERVVWHVVKSYAAKVGFTGLAPHDLRRSCAKLCHSAGGELEQIQFLLGHVSVQTTERYLGCKQRANYQPTRPAILWLDSRSAAEAQRMAKTAGAEIAQSSCDFVKDRRPVKPPARL